MSDSEERIMSEVEGAGAEEEEDLEVEEILDCRRVNGKDLYLLKWKGFTEEHNSWEPEENLGCPELLEAFKAKQQLKKEAPRVSGPKKVRRSKEVKDRRASKDFKDRRDSNDLKDRRDSQDDEQKPQLQPVEADDTSNVTPPAKKKKVNKLEKDDSIDQYETKQISMVSSDVKTKQTSKMISNNKIKQIPKVVIMAKDEAKPRGFDRGLEAEKILGATDCLGGLTFLMKWKGSEDADLVEAQQANQICPQVVIRFYEERLTWHSTQDIKEFTAKV